MKNIPDLDVKLQTLFHPTISILSPGQTARDSRW